MPSRESFHDLTETKRDRFLEAVLTIKNTIANPAAPVAEQVSIYDQFVALHGAVMSLRLPSGQRANFGHQNDLFLPWHRQYLVDFEKALQQVHADVTIPYWDWTKRSQTRNVLFQPNFLGTIGNRQLAATRGYFAQTAPANPPAWWPNGFPGWEVRLEFQPPGWRNLPPHLVKSLIRAGDSTTRLPTTTQINSLIARNDRYETFRLALEAGQLATASRTHNAGHLWVGGHMGTGFSPMDPVFFMHHANVDRLWAGWQKRTDRDNDYPDELFPGIRRDTSMWPWVGATSGYQIMNAEIRDYVRDHSADPEVTADDVLDIQTLNYDYA